MLCFYQQPSPGGFVLVLYGGTWATLPIDAVESTERPRVPV